MKSKVFRSGNWTKGNKNKVGKNIKVIYYSILKFLYFILIFLFCLFIFFDLISWIIKKHMTIVT